jgi:predicted nucleic acid-binding protein
VSGFLLDTNVPSELIRSRPDPRVEKWVFAQDERSLFLSAVTIGELRRGFVILPASKRRTELERWFHDDLIPRFHSRILALTHPIADRWGALDGECQLRVRIYLTQKVSQAMIFTKAGVRKCPPPIGKMILILEQVGVMCNIWACYCAVTAGED